MPRSLLRIGWQVWPALIRFHIFGTSNKNKVKRTKFGDLPRHHHSSLPSALFYTLVSSNSIWCRFFSLELLISSRVSHSFSPGYHLDTEQKLWAITTDCFRRPAPTCFQTFWVSAFHLLRAPRLVYFTLAKSYTSITSLSFPHLFIHSLYPFLRISTVPLKLSSTSSARDQLSPPWQFWSDLKRGFLSQRTLPHLLQVGKPAHRGTHHLQDPPSQGTTRSRGRGGILWALHQHF